MNRQPSRLELFGKLLTNLGCLLMLIPFLFVGIVLFVALVIELFR